MEKDKSLPIGFAMSLAMDNNAMENYSNLDPVTQDSITRYIQSSTTGYDAKRRIDVAVESLSNNNLKFLEWSLDKIMHMDVICPCVYLLCDLTKMRYYDRIT